ncbi:MAG: site-2 protease family protein [Candidatus Bathyarchaeia archaeon]
MTEPPLTNTYVDEILEELFQVEEGYIDRGTPTYIITPRDRGDNRLCVKKSFRELAERIRGKGYLPRLSRVEGGYQIMILRKRQHGTPSYKKNIILFMATLGTVFLDGYLRSNNPILTQVLMIDTPVWGNAIIFALGIITIFGLHELGHKAFSMLRGIEASMPYFIPAPPGMGGTFGAVITQKEPPINRDDLFDLGLSGPLMGFIATVFVGIVGLKLSFVVPEANLTRWMLEFPEVGFTSLPFPPLLDLLSKWLKPTPDGYILLMHPLGFAAWVGCLITFLNLIPAWQLDGGHVSRSLLGKEVHRVVSVAGVLIMAISGYFVMAAMVLFFMIRGGGGGVELLDDVSPLSRSRKLAVVLYLVIIGLSLVMIFPFMI